MWWKPAINDTISFIHKQMRRKKKKEKEQKYYSSCWRFDCSIFWLFVGFFLSAFIASIQSYKLKSSSHRRRCKFQWFSSSQCYFWLLLLFLSINRLNCEYEKRPETKRNTSITLLEVIFTINGNWIMFVIDVFIFNPLPFSNDEKCSWII